ncbi:hypothetical protein [Nonomuraea sp. NPDC003709]|uniref:hypothetical protein n=1 Tax=Nonomuraea sp. NPDC003709 TaxID=3154450 RepID=UPI0033BD7234
MDDAEIEAFLAAGYTRRQVLDVVLGVGVKTQSNYTSLQPDGALIWANQLGAEGPLFEDTATLIIPNAFPDAALTARSEAIAPAQRHRRHIVII